MGLDRSLLISGDATNDVRAQRSQNDLLNGSYQLCFTAKTLLSELFTPFTDILLKVVIQGSFSR